MLLPGGSPACKLLLRVPQLRFLAQDGFLDIVLSEESSDVFKVSVRKVFHHHISASLL
jgi:hypothetical protein